MTYTSLYDTIFLQGGNVGIGSASPQFAMDIAGDMHVQNSITLGSNIGIVRITYDQNSNIIKCLSNTNNKIYFDQGFLTKGDLLVYDGTTQVRLPVGTDAQVLSVNAATSTGLMWKNAESVGIGTNLTLTELSVEKITSLASNINFSQKTLSNISDLYANNIVYKQEPLALIFDKIEIPFTTYYKALHWIHEGASAFVRKPTHMLINSYLHTTCNAINYLQDPGFKYDTRIVDITHNTVLGTATFSNTLPSVNAVDIMSVPTSNIELELQVRKGTNGDYVYIDTATILYT